MSKSGVTPEMLMAFADQEIGRDSAEAIEQAARDDAARAETLAMFRATRRAARDAFADVLAEPVPERLVEAVLGAPERSNVIALPLRRLQRAALPLAACLAIAIGIVGYFLGQSALGPRSSGLGAVAYGDPAVVDALASLPSGATQALHEIRGNTATLRVAGSYRVEGGYCRAFSLSNASDSVRGLGCKRNAGWTIEAVVADAPVASDGQYRPASGAAELVEAALDSLGAGEPLAAEQERSLITNGWKE